MASWPWKVLPLTVSTPDEASSMPPPNPPPTALPGASFLLILLLATLSVPRSEMPPPATAELPLTVQLVSVAVAD